MSFRSLRIWDRAQLILLRWLTFGLGTMDRLLNVHWGQSLLDRLSSRWQTQISQIDLALAQIEEERQQLQTQAEALALHAAAVYLGGRSLARGELSFDPADPRDEEKLDATIDLLVKQQLSSVEVEEPEAGQYLYRVEPAWAEIHTRLSLAAEQAEPEIADWFREGTRFIEEAFLSHS